MNNENISTNGNGHSEKKETMPNSKRVYVNGKLFDDIKVPFREIELSQTRLHDGSLEDNGSHRVYDTSGPWGDENQTCDVKKGLQPLRLKWIKDRDDVEEYDGRIVNPLDNGYKSNDEVKKAGSNGVGKLEYFPGLRRKPLKAKSGKAATQMYYAKKG